MLELIFIVFSRRLIFLWNVIMKEFNHPIRSHISITETTFNNSSISAIIVLVKVVKKWSAFDCISFNMHYNQWFLFRCVLYFSSKQKSFRFIMSNYLLWMSCFIYLSFNRNFTWSLDECFRNYIFLRFSKTIFWLFKKELKNYHAIE
jgi:hypothetical protein